MPEEGSKFKYREAFIGALITALVPVVIGLVVKTMETRPTPAPHAEPTPTPAYAPPAPDNASIGSAAESSGPEEVRVPSPVAVRTDYAARTTLTPMPTFAPSATPFARDTPTIRYTERRPPPTRVPEVKTRPFAHEPKRHSRYLAADGALNRLFNAALAGMNETERWNLTMEQRNWLNARTGLWDQGGDEAVAEFTEQRNRELRRRFGL